MTVITREELEAPNGSSIIGFNNGGIGAEDRTVEGKLVDTVSVLDFIPVAQHAAIFSGGSGYDASGDIQDAINHIQSELGSGTLDFHGLQLTLDAGITWDPEFVSLRGNGAQLYFGNMSSGTAITVVNTLPTTGLDRALHNAAHEMQGFQLIGPGVAEDEVVAISLDDTEAPTVVANVAISAVAFENFATDIFLGSGAFCLRCRECTFSNTSEAVPTTPSINIPTGENSGERNGFLGCTWYARDRVLDQANGNATTIFTDCSFDYGTRMFDVTGGQVFINGCHIEGNDDTDYWLSVAGANAAVFIDNSALVITAAKTAFPPFHADSSATNGGILIGQLQISTSFEWTTPLIGGTGRAPRPSRLSQYVAGDRAPHSAFANLVAHGGFEDSDWTGSWTVSNPTYVDRTSAKARGGTYALEIEGVISVTQSAVCTRPARPGDYFSGELYYQTENLAGTGGTFFVGAEWIDDAGNSLDGGVASLAETTNVGSWTRAATYFVQSAPAGTTAIRVTISLFGVTSGSPKAYVDDVLLTLS